MPGGASTCASKMGSVRACLEVAAVAVPCARPRWAGSGPAGGNIVAGQKGARRGGGGGRQAVAQARVGEDMNMLARQRGAAPGGAGDCRRLRRQRGGGCEHAGQAKGGVWGGRGEGTAGSCAGRGGEHAGQAKGGVWGGRDCRRWHRQRGVKMLARQRVRTGEGVSGSFRASCVAEAPRSTW